MAYESDDMPVVFYYEVNLDDNRFCLRSMEIFANRQVSLIHELYHDAIEAVSIPTKESFNLNEWGEGFQAFIVSKNEFEEVWESGIYNGNLYAP